MPRNYLRCMCNEHLSHWSDWLSTVELWYNTNFHTSLQLTPFEALYGYKPVYLPLGPYHDSRIPASSDIVQERLQGPSNIEDDHARA